MENHFRYMSMKGQKQNLLLFIVGFAGGIFLYLWNHNEVRSDKTYFIETILWRMGNYEINANTYFIFLMQKRLSVWFILTICATTFLGIWVIRLSFAWSGACFGGILSMYLYWYGGKGILYLFFLLFPQMICYVPAYIGLCHLLTLLYRQIYYSDHYAYGYERDARWHKIQKVGLYFMFLLVAIIGVIFESYVNPFVVKKIVNFF